MNTTRYALALATSWLVSSPSLAEDLTDHHSAATYRNGLSVIQRTGANQFERIHSTSGSAWYYDATVSSQGFWDPQNLLGEGVFKSGPAAVVSDNGQTMHAFGRGTNDKIWRSRSVDGGSTWPGGWSPMGTGLFSSGPAAAIAGSKIHVFARGMDNRMFRAYSSNGGSTWSILWTSMGAGVFNSAPAAAVSADGQKIHVFARGTDNRMWRAFSPDGGATWPALWDPMSTGIFNSPPAAVASADGQRVVVVGRGLNNQFYTRRSINGGTTWSAWTSIGNGISSSAPSAAMSANGMQVHVFGREVMSPDCQFCPVPRLWRAYSSDGGVTWSIAWSFIDPQPVEVN